MDITKFANSLSTTDSPLQNIPKPKDLTKVDAKKLASRLALLETAESEVFDKKAHMLAVVQEHNDKGWKVQPHNRSGDPEGKADFETSEDLWLLPAVGEIIQVGEGRNV